MSAWPASLRTSVWWAPTLVGLFAAASPAAWASGAAFAESARTPWQCWQAGALHPLQGLDHLAAFLAVGVWSGSHVRQAWVVALSFVLMLVGGAWLGFSRAEPLPVELLIAASVVVLGVLLAARLRMPMVAAAWLAMAIAFVHGIAHGGDLRGPAEFWALFGMACSATLLLCSGLLAGRVLANAPPLAWRLLGLAVAATGGWLVMQTL